MIPKKIWLTIVMFLSWYIVSPIQTSAVPDKIITITAKALPGDCSGVYFTPTVENGKNVQYYNETIVPCSPGYGGTYSVVKLHFYGDDAYVTKLTMEVIGSKYPFLSNPNIPGWWWLGATIPNYNAMYPAPNVEVDFETQ